ncbi:hypothetical protein GUJ93_ZPchr0001g32811 [Zizania palustris]|uniref:Uncharacterized protein n=1 Tax=Zizania palustris TaxID=103762 RepID=A0A8J5RQV5_ZIZPA|nr:hypothetical protein GUJ93_ZPchr0001g32811 [Zizania palustris]
MAHYQEVDYCSEEVRSSVGAPASGFLHHGGGAQQQQQHLVVKEKFQEVDNYCRAGGGSDHLVVRESKLEEDVNTGRTGEFHERKESYLYRAN